MVTRFERDDILTLLRELGQRLHAKGIRAEVFVLGGSAISIAYNERRVTADIDALFAPVEEVQREVLAMARDKRLPLGWLNNAVQETLHGVASDDSPRDVFTADGVEVKVASPQYILALKAMISTRELDRDIEDAAMLCNRLGITDEREVEALVRRYFTSGHPFGAQELRFERIIERASALRGAGAAPEASATAPLARTCGHWMKIAARPCGLPPGHAGQHR